MTRANAGSVQDRLDFMGMDQRMRSVLRGLSPTIVKSIGPALDVFYDKVRKVPATRQIFKDETRIAHAKASQEQHWEVIASAEFGSQYADKVRAIGRAHARLGLELRWYIAGYALITEQLVHAVVADEWPDLLRLRRSKGHAEGMAEAVSVLVKAVMLDMDLAISTYLEALDEQRQRAEQARLEIEKNQGDALKALSAALGRLATGDLNVRIDQPLAAEFAGLKSDFNTTVSKLQQAMSNVRLNSNTISFGTREISSAADDLSRRTEVQSASLEETASAMDEITATVKSAALGVAHASDVVKAAKLDAEQGRAVVSRAIEAMGNIDRSSEKISRIVGVINEIAFQTNILALNAAVEAARVGDEGRGFAVVAAEVRALAQRSAEAAKEIKALIVASTGHVKEGVELVAETGGSFERIVAQVIDVNAVVANIAGGAQQQVTALQEVNTAVNQIDQATQQNAAMAEQLTTASRSLAQETMELDRLINSFKLGEHAAAEPPQPDRISAVRSAQIVLKGERKAG